MDALGGFTDVTDTRPVPGVEVSILVNRSEAARFGADVSLLGQAVQLLTQGITVADYRRRLTANRRDPGVHILRRVPARYF